MVYRIAGAFCLVFSWEPRIYLHFPREAKKSRNTREPKSVTLPQEIWQPKKPIQLCSKLPLSNSSVLTPVEPFPSVTQFVLSWLSRK